MGKGPVLGLQDGSQARGTDKHPRMSKDACERPERAVNANEVREKDYQIFPPDVSVVMEVHVERFRLALRRAKIWRSEVLPKFNRPPEPSLLHLELQRP
jgi:hypothetical protein